MKVSYFLKADISGGEDRAYRRKENLIIFFTPIDEILNVFQGK